MTELCKAIKECRRGVSYKDGPTDWYIHRLMKAEALQRDILSGRYKLRPGTVVKIYRPKKREAVAPWFRDRVWQRSMCNNGVYHDLTHSLCYDNAACQVGKGTNQSFLRTIRFLQEIYRKTGSNEGWGVHIDVHQYFPKTPHDEIIALDERLITEPLFLPYLNEIVKSVADPRTEEVILSDPFGERGTGLGSQANQLNQVALPSDIDHELKTRCRWSQRYMDDFLILDTDKEKCVWAAETIDRMLKEKGLTCANRNGIFRLKDGFWYLRHRFILLDTGKVVVKMHPESIRNEKNALKGLRNELIAGRTDMNYIRAQYQTFVAQATYCSSNGVLRAMDKFYTELFREKPKYVYTRRYLYGNHQKRKGSASGRENQERDSHQRAGQVQGND